MIEETEKSVYVHVRRALQEELLQRVLETVDSFFRILQKGHSVSVSDESALEELDASMVVKVTQS